MKHQPSPIHSVLLAALLLGGSLVANAAENTGGQPNPPATPTRTVGATPAPSNLTIKNKSRPSYVPQAAKTGGGTPSSGMGEMDGMSNLTIKNKSRLHDQIVAPGSNGIEERKVGVGDRDKDKPFARETTNEICPPKCGPLNPTPTIPPAPQAAQTGGGKPNGIPTDIPTPSISKQ